MMLHAAVFAAFFVDQVQQAPVVVQCVQTEPNPEWKWWLGALAPWVGPLLSGVVSIYVAWKVFNWQGKKEQEQWLRDQRRAEWRSLLDRLCEIRFPMLLAAKQGKLLPLESSRKLFELSQCFEGSVFIDASKLGDFSKQLAECGSKYLGESDDKYSEEEQEQAIEELRILLVKIRNAAEYDLIIATKR